jgi:hypothetical protein
MKEKLPRVDFIDVDFDTRSDARPGTDIDVTSPTLREFHRILWSKTLPSGQEFDLSATGRSPYLVHESTIGRYELSSDFLAGWHRRCRDFWSALDPEEFERQERVARTIGGYIVFPSRTVNRQQTINMRRGTHHRIGDRFDLSLECIRRHYLGEQSPLSDVLERYKAFFGLFKSFEGYVDFFLLNDMVGKEGKVIFFSEFEDFKSAPMPTSLESYLEYREKVLEFVQARNSRIAAQQRNPVQSDASVG